MNDAAFVDTFADGVVPAALLAATRLELVVHTRGFGTSAMVDKRPWSNWGFGARRSIDKTPDTSAGVTAPSGG